eukprot:m51a1_g2627 putative dek1-calpain-like protein (1792) ;mRNA; f:555417-561091
MDSVLEERAFGLTPAGLARQVRHAASCGNPAAVVEVLGEPRAGDATWALRHVILAAFPPAPDAPPSPLCREAVSVLLRDRGADAVKLFVRWSSPSPCNSPTYFACSKNQGTVDDEITGAYASAIAEADAAWLCAELATWAAQRDPTPNRAPDYAAVAALAILRHATTRPAVSKACVDALVHRCELRLRDVAVPPTGAWWTTSFELRGGVFLAAHSGHSAVLRDLVAAAGSHDVNAAVDGSRTALEVAVVTARNLEAATALVAAGARADLASSPVLRLAAECGALTQVEGMTQVLFRTHDSVAEQDLIVRRACESLDTAVARAVIVAQLAKYSRATLPLAHMAVAWKRARDSGHNAAQLEGVEQWAADLLLYALRSGIATPEDGSLQRAVEAGWLTLSQSLLQNTAVKVSDSADDGKTCALVSAAAQRDGRLLQLLLEHTKDTDWAALRQAAVSCLLTPRGGRAVSLRRIVHHCVRYKVDLEMAFTKTDFLQDRVLRSPLRVSNLLMFGVRPPENAATPPAPERSDSGKRPLWQKIAGEWEGMWERFQEAARLCSDKTLEGKISASLLLGDYENAWDIVRSATSLAVRWPDAVLADPQSVVVLSKSGSPLGELLAALRQRSELPKQFVDSSALVMSAIDTLCDRNDPSYESVVVALVSAGAPLPVSILPRVVSRPAIVQAFVVSLKGSKLEPSSISSVLKCAAVGLCAESLRLLLQCCIAPSPDGAESLGFDIRDVLKAVLERPADSSEAGNVLEALRAWCPALLTQNPLVLHSLAALPSDTAALAFVGPCIDAGVNPSATDDQGRSALHLFASKGWLRASHRLIAAGASMAAQDYAGDLPINYVTRENNEPLVLAMLEAMGQQCDRSLPALGRLLTACCRNSFWMAAEKLAEKQVSAMERDENGNTALMWSLRNNAPEPVLDSLMALPQDLNAKNKEGARAFSYCDSLRICFRILGGKAELSNPFPEKNKCPVWRLYSLLTVGATRFLRDSQLRKAVIAVADDEPQCSLVCCTSSDPRAMRCVLRRTRRDDETWWRPLHIAAAMGNVALVRELIKTKLSACEADDLGNTPLHYACMHSTTASALALIERLKQEHATQSITATNYKQQSPLSLALDGTSAETVTAMIKERPELSMITSKKGFLNKECRDGTALAVTAYLHEIHSKAGAKYEDMEFPAAASERTLWETGSTTVQAWKRASDHKPSTLFSKSGPHAGDVEQGELNDPDFVTVLSILAAHEGGALVRTGLFLPTAEEDLTCGLCCVLLHTLHEKRFTFCVIDDNVACANVRRKSDAVSVMQPLYAHSRGRNQWYVALLEKCIAKTVGGYNRLNGIPDRDVLEYFVGGSFGTLSLSSPDMIRERVRGNAWHRISALSSDPCRSVLMTCSLTNPDGATGLVTGHVYGVLRFVTLLKRYHVVQMFNAYDSDQWTGDWSAQSSRWTPQITKSLPPGLRSPDGTSGVFFMDFEQDFLRLFGSINYCTTQRDNGTCTSAVSHQTTQNGAMYFALHMAREGNIRVEATATGGPVQLVIGVLDPMVWVAESDVEGRMERVMLHEHNVFEAMALHMDTIARTRRGSFDDNATTALEVHVSADTLASSSGVVFVFAFSRPRAAFEVSVNTEEHKNGEKPLVTRVVPVELAPAVMDLECSYVRAASPVSSRSKPLSPTSEGGGRCPTSDTLRRNSPSRLGKRTQLEILQLQEEVSRLSDSMAVMQDQYMAQIAEKDLEVQRLQAKIKKDFIPVRDLKKAAYKSMSTPMMQPPQAVEEEPALRQSLPSIKPVFGSQGPSCNITQQRR